LALERAVEPRVVDRLAERPGEEAHALDVLVVELFLADRIEQLQHADHPGMGEKRDRQDRPRLELVGQIAAPARVAVHVVDHLAAAVLRHAPDDPLADRHPQVANLARDLAADHPEEKLAAGLVHLPDRAGLGAAKLFRPVEGEAQDLIDVEAAGQLDSDLEQAFVLAQPFLNVGAFPHGGHRLSLSAAGQSITETRGGKWIPPRVASALGGRSLESDGT
jgi:hypothetical protein